MRRLLPWILPVLMVAVGVTVLGGLGMALGDPGLSVLIGSLASVEFALNTNAAALTSAMAVLIALVLLTVQLTAQRYSFSVITIFVHDRLNSLLISLFILTIVYNLWLGMLLTDEYIPPVATLLAMGLMTVCFSMLPPYILHLFDVIRPDRILDHLQRQFFKAITSRASERTGAIKQRRAVATQRVSQMGDIALTAIDLSDSAVARHAVWTLYGSVARYLDEKPGQPSDWFALEEDQFRGRHELIVREIEASMTWVEVRMLDELREIFFATLNKLHDVNNTVALVLRLLGEQAVERHDAGVSRAVVTCFNTFLRAAINQGDVRAGYHVLYQYRLLANAAMDHHADLTLEIAHRLSYYGDAATGGPLLWMSAAAAYDLRRLAEQAQARGAGPAGGPPSGPPSGPHGRTDRTDGGAIPAAPPAPDAVVAAMVANLIDTVQRGEAKQSPALPQLYKMVIALGAFFLRHDVSAQVGPLAAALAALPRDVLERLGAELTGVTNPVFWELTDRVVNFDYVEEGARARIPDFLALVAESAARVAPTAAPTPA